MISPGRAVSFVFAPPSAPIPPIPHHRPILAYPGGDLVLVLLFFAGGAQNLRFGTVLYSSWGLMFFFLLGQICGGQGAKCNFKINVYCIAAIV